jgi:hypothetical protein
MQVVPSFSEDSAMNEREAVSLAEALGGEAWHSGGGIWLVPLTNSEGSLVVFSDDLVCEYRDEEAFRDGDAIRTISLA